MEVDTRSVKFKISPASYPGIKIYYKDRGEQEYIGFETKVTFPQEYWLNLANTCQEAAKSMNAFSSQKIVSALNLMSQMVMVEIEAENRRVQYKDAYEALADYVFEVNNRADLDKVRKGQMIYDRACQLGLKF